MAAMSDPRHYQTGPGEVPTTTRPALSIAISREMYTVVMTLEGLLDEDTSSLLAAALRDLTEDQGNLSVAVDARRLTLSDPALIAVFAVAERAVARRGGTLTVVEPTIVQLRPRPAWPEHAHKAATPLDPRRAGLTGGPGRADHPAGGGRVTPSPTRGAHHDSM